MTYNELCSLSREDLVILYDQKALNTDVSLDFIKQEIWRRDSDHLNHNMERMTRGIQYMTIAIMVFTVFNVIVVLAKN